MISQPLRSLPPVFFSFDERSQLFIRTHNETLSVASMCISNKDRLPFAIKR